MHEPHAAGPAAACPVTRALAAFEAISTAIAGFALLAGARAFAFTALLAWREPVIGGAGLVLLGLIGWLRWCWRRRDVRHAQPDQHPRHVQGRTTAASTGCERVRQDAHRSANGNGRATC